jgi:hypothetical protein
MSDPTKTIEQRFLNSAYKSHPALRALSFEDAQALAIRATKEARGAKEVDNALRKRGLVSNVTRARGYTPFSPFTQGVHHVSVVPYTSPDPKSDLVGSVGISDGEPSSGVVVQLKDNQVINIWLYDFVDGKLVERTIPPDELMKSGPQKFNETWDRGPANPNLRTETASAIAVDAFKSLLVDDYSSLIYSEEDVRQLAHVAPVISAISELQYMRHLGTPTANSCCCCCSCCWGSCSSCSATAATYVNNTYYQ